MTGQHRCLYEESDTSNRASAKRRARTGEGRGRPKTRNRKMRKGKLGNANGNQEVEKPRSGVLWPPTGAGLPLNRTTNRFQGAFVYLAVWLNLALATLIFL